MIHQQKLEIIYKIYGFEEEIYFYALLIESYSYELIIKRGIFQPFYRKLYLKIYIEFILKCSRYNN